MVNLWLCKSPCPKKGDPESSLNMTQPLYSSHVNVVEALDFGTGEEVLIYPWDGEPPL